MSKSLYLLDTNILSAVIKHPAGYVAQKMAAVGPATLCTSIVVACEIRYGSGKKGLARLADRVEALLEQLPVLPLDNDADRHYADLRCELEQRGQPIGATDQLIAAHTMALDLTLVMHNTDEFSRIPGLRLADWLADE